MNRDLEKEYKELMAENAPDLWERIEVGLEPKQSAAKKGKLWKGYRTWGLAVAACLFMIVTVPVILKKNTDESSRSDNTPAYDIGVADGNLSMADGSLNAVENAGTLFEAPSDDDDATYTIMGTVIGVSEEEGRRAYIVDIFRTDLTELSEGDSIRLYSDWDFSKEILEGEEYLFDISVSVDNDGTREYLIEDIW